MAVIKTDKNGWNAIVAEVIETEGVKRMKRVADASNANLDRPGYMVSVEGSLPLSKRNYRATVITATQDAMWDNAKNNTLVDNFHYAAGD